MNEQTPHSAPTTTHDENTMYFYDKNAAEHDVLQAGELFQDDNGSNIIRRGNTTFFNVGTVFTPDEVNDAARSILGSTSERIDAQELTELQSDVERRSELSIRLGSLAAVKQLEAAGNLERSIIPDAILFEKNKSIIDELQRGIVSYNYPAGTRNTLSLNTLQSEAALLDKSRFDSLAEILGSTNTSTLQLIYDHYGVNFEAAQVLTRPSDNSTSVQMTVYPLSNGTLHFTEQRIIPSADDPDSAWKLAQPPYVEVIVGTKDYILPSSE